MHDHDDGMHDHGGDSAELLDLDGDVLRSYWSDAIAWIRREAKPSLRRCVLDLGAGSGVGTIALAQRFGAADVIAVDVSDEMLDHIQVKALFLGLAPRIHRVRADLDAGWPDVSAVDLTWASMSMHHLAEPDRVLADVFAATRPGGLLAVAEFDEQLRFLPDEIGPGLEDRLLGMLAEDHAHTLPELGSNWALRVAAAGFTVLDERTFTVDLRPPHPPSTARYAQRWLERLRSGFAERLSDDDLATLALLLDGDGPKSLRRRDDLHVRGTRTVTLARRR